MLNIHAILKNVENQTVAGTNFEYLSNLKNKNPHSNAKRFIRILGVCQAAWHTKCDDEVSLHFNVFLYIYFFCCQSVIGLNN